MSNRLNRNPFDSILPAEISNVKGVYLAGRTANPSLLPAETEQAGSRCVPHALRRASSADAPLRVFLSILTWH